MEYHGRAGIRADVHPSQGRNVHDNMDVGAVHRMVDRFLDVGMGYFNNAYYYHDGASKRVVGSELMAHYPYGSFILVDKMSMKLIRDEIDSSVQERFLEKQIGRCDVNRFDSYLPTISVGRSTRRRSASIFRLPETYKGRRSDPEGGLLRP